MKMTGLDRIAHLRKALVRMAGLALLVVGLLLPTNASAASATPNSVPGQTRCLVVVVSAQGNASHVAKIKLSIRNNCGDEATGNWSMAVFPNCSEDVTTRTFQGRFDIPDGATNSWTGTGACVDLETGETLPWGASISGIATGRTFTDNKSVVGSGSTTAAF